MSATSQPVVHRRIDWEALGGEQPLTPGAENRVTVQRETIPILFVPGIMGSRLRGPQRMLWDPDDPIRFALDYGLRLATARERFRALIGPDGYHPHHLRLCMGNADVEAERGWANLVQSVYRPVRRALEMTPLTALQGLCFNVPVHAFGYNWTQNPRQSGAQLAHAIDALIAHYSARGRCAQVMVVTHSMGGLVARAAALLHGAESCILGMVHAMQPVAGVPAAYTQMKMGMGRVLRESTRPEPTALEALESFLLGRDGAMTSAMLGNMPAALALLPSNNYPQDDQGRDWLQLATAPHAPLQTLIPSGNVYRDVYRQREAFWGLVNPQALRPGETDAAALERAWQAYLDHLGDAEAFHQALGARMHPCTTHVVSTGQATCARAVYTLSARGNPMEQATVQTASALEAVRTRHLRTQGDYQAFGHDSAHAPWHVRLRAEDTLAGDGTVPVAAAAVAQASSQNVCTAMGAPHGTGMGDPQVVRHVQAAVLRILQRRMNAAWGGSP
jgi:pimeloyl-ACP methyl ester carboxylesterase